MKFKTQLSTAILLTAFALPASAILIDDGYWGATPVGTANKDVIGGASFYVHDMEVTLTGTILNVQINTAFAGNAGISGIGYGDLFLSSAWNPAGTAADNYGSDNHANGTLWTHGFALDGDRFSSANLGGTGALYGFDAGSSNADNAILSQEVATFGQFREDQEVVIDTASTTTTALGNATSWMIDADDFISFSIDLAGTSLLDGPQIALHWGMTCGNDVIEGAYNIPEPAILSLLAMGLIGVGVSARRKA